jgi:hypothetical protein
MHYQDSPPTNMVIDQQNGIQWNKPLSRFISSPLYQE